MADFVAVLKKTIEGLANNTPEMREKVFEKARSTIEAKLAAIDPPPPQAVADRQRKALEDAVAVVRSEYDAPADEDDEDFESLMASLAETPSPDAPDNVPAEAAPAGDAVRHGEEPAASRDEPDLAAGDDPVPSTEEPERSEPPLMAPVPPFGAQPPETPERAEPEIGQIDTADEPDPEPAFGDGSSSDERSEDRADPPLTASAFPIGAGAQEEPETVSGLHEQDDLPDPPVGEDAPAAALPEGSGDASRIDDDPLILPDAAPNGETAPDSAPVESETAADKPVAAAPRKRGWKGLAAAVLALLLIGGGAYAVWLNQDDFSRLVGLGGDVDVVDDAGPADEDDAPQQAATEAGDLDAVDDTEAAEAPPTGPEDAEKFTQRLMPDGSEIDEGPAEGTATIGEGSSIAAVTPDGEGDAGEGVQIAQNDDEDDEASPEDEASVPVGQRAIFYEERTNTAQGSAQTGTTVWRVVEESPGGDLPPEPAIRAEATIPDMNLQLRMTIRRNGDETLPASHIIEMIFLTPDDFEGGGIDNVSRISFKDSEQAAGNPLLGIPAKIADGFFLLALNDSPSDLATNMALMRRQSWVDIPLVYRSGRRALVTLEKGVPGGQIFQEVINAWSEESSG